MMNPEFVSLAFISLLSFTATCPALSWTQSDPQKISEIYKFMKKISLKKLIIKIRKEPPPGYYKTLRKY